MTATAGGLALLGVFLLTSKGSAGVAGAGFVTLAATLSTIHTVPVAEADNALVVAVEVLFACAVSETAPVAFTSAFFPMNALVAWCTSDVS